ncbi:DNA polymerase I [bacterium]|nr:DNA polymerase I [bacterium]
MVAKRQSKLAIIDSHALIHRAYHALPPMSTRLGVPTNAAFGFTTMLLKMFTTLKPTHVVAAFDMKGPTFRHEMFKDYKAHRGELEDDLISQFDLVREVVRAFNIPVLEKQGFEADDIIGTVTEKINDGVKKVIITGDMDTLQLVDDDTSVFTLKRGIGDTILYNEELVHEKYGFGPEHVIDYKGLAGDSSDNIPGVAGIGDKTARELVGEYGSIEDVFKHVQEFSTRAKNRLTGHQKEAVFSRKLATIKRNVPIKFKLADAELADFDVQTVTDLFAELEFKNLATKLPKSSRGGQGSLFDKPVEDAPPPEMPANYHLVETPKDQEELRQKLGKAKLIAFDTENETLGAREHPIVGMSFAAKIGKKIEAWYVPVDRESVMEWKQLLEDPAVGKMGHNLKYDYEVLRQSDITLGPIAFDSMIASYLLHPGARQHGLDTLAVQELNHHTISITTLIGSGPTSPRLRGAGKDQKKMSEVPLDILAPYACEDADIAYQLYETFAPRIKKEGLTAVFEELELPLIPVLAEMELTGVKLDVEVMAVLHKKVAGRITRLEKQIWEAAGEEFNIRSTQQLRVVLYEKLNLPTDKISRTQSGFSTAAKELAKLRGEHKIVEMLEEYREVTKLQSTYLEPLPEMVAPDTGRIHGSFNQVVAATGRLSSQDPNLQNIPVRTELGQEIRTAFIPERGKRFVKADYSQLELRIAAHLSHDEKMIDAFRAGEDIHRATAAWVNGIEQKKVTDKQRRDAKTLNFGVLYGMGPMNFAQSSGISMEEARSFIERYKQQYEGITNLIVSTIEQAEETEFVETMMGRRRYVPEINASSPAVRAAAERAAFNFPIQGTAADILKQAMIALQAHLDKKYPDADMVLTVHDELVCEVPIKETAALAKDMKRIMEGVVTLDVPVIVDVGIGSDWSDAKPTK